MKRKEKNTCADAPPFQGVLAPEISGAPLAAPRATSWLPAHHQLPSRLAHGQHPTYHHRNVLVFHFHRRRDETRVRDMFPEKNESVARTLDVADRLLFVISYGVIRITWLSYSLCERDSSSA